MDQLGEWRPEDLQAELIDAQAHVHIVEGDGVAYLVHALDLQIKVAAQDQAGGGAGALTTSKMVEAQIAGIVAQPVVARMGGQAVDADDDTGVLHHIVLPQQLGAYRSNIRSYGQTHHFLEPVGMQDLDVVVDQPDVFPRGELDTDIVQGGVVEGIGVRQDAYTAGLEFVEVLQGLGIAGLVVDDDEFQIRVVGLGQQTFHAGMQELVGIPGGNDQADLGQSLGQWPVGA